MKTSSGKAKAAKKEKSSSSESQSSSLLENQPNLRRSKNAEKKNLQKNEASTESAHKESQDFRKAPQHAEYGSQISAVPSIVLFVFGFVLAFSLGARALTGCPWWAMIAYYFAGLVAFYIWHWQAHHRFWWNKACYEHHKYHHWSLYPPNHYFGKESELAKINYNPSEGFRLRDLLPGYTSIGHELLLYVLAAGILYTSHLLGASGATIACAFVGYFLMGFIANYIHQAFHIRGHFLERFDWFHELRALHYIHHLGTAKHNYAVINFGLDKLLGTYFVEDPKEVRAEQRRKEQEIQRQAILNPPPGVNSTMVQRALNAGLFTPSVLMLNPTISGLPDHAEDSDILKQNAQSSAWSRGFSAIIVRMGIVAVALLLWYETQEIIGSWGLMLPKVSPSEIIFDRLHILVAPLNAQLLVDTQMADKVLIFSSLGIDIVTGGLLLYSILGRTARPLVGLLVVLMMRQICMCMVLLAAPDNMIWRDPGVPSLFVTYATENDFFFSGHTALATVGAVEAIRLTPNRLWPKLIASLFAFGFIAFEVGALLVLQAHWTMDILTALLAGRYATLFAARYAPFVDRFLP